MAMFRFTSNKDNKLRLLKCARPDENVRSMGKTHIEIFSNKEIDLEGCKGIDEFKNDYVKIKTAEGYITVFGEALDIPVFDGSFITVTGKIDSVDFYR